MGRPISLKKLGNRTPVNGPFDSWKLFLKGKGFSDLSAQGLREQFILRQIEEKVDLYEIAKKLGLKTVMTIEKYR